MSIGARLKLIRKKHKQSLDETATIFDITKQTLSRYENEKRTPDNEFLESFGRQFSLSGDWLLYGKPPIFQQEVAKTDVNGIFLELAAELTRISNRKTTELKMIDIPQETLSNTPENYVLMLEYMLKYESVRRDILKFFYLFQKPEADKQQKKEGDFLKADGRI